MAPVTHSAAQKMAKEKEKSRLWHPDLGIHFDSKPAPSNRTSSVPSTPRRKVHRSLGSVTPPVVSPGAYDDSPGTPDGESDVWDDSPHSRKSKRDIFDVPSTPLTPPSPGEPGDDAEIQSPLTRKSRRRRQGTKTEDRGDYFQRRDLSDGGVASEYAGA
jgi:hypothetical protein